MDQMDRAELNQRASASRQMALSLLGLAKRAGVVAGGTESVRTLCRSGKARLVVLSADCSDNTQKRVRNCCVFYQVPLLHTNIDMRQLGRAIGKAATSAAAIGDNGLAERLLTLFSQQDEGSEKEDKRCSGCGNAAEKTIGEP